MHSEKTLQSVENDSAKEILRKYLAEKNLRPSKERDLILDEIMRGTGHFDADEFFTRLKAKGLKASRATVYNTLDLFVACGLISKYRFGENTSRYERAHGRPRHDHLICLGCGDIIEFVDEKLNALQQDIAHEHGFRIQSSSLQIFGTCSKCLKKER